MSRSALVASVSLVLLRGCVPSCAPVAARPDFAIAVPAPSADATWPEVVNVMRAGAGVPPVVQSADGSHYAASAALCLANTGQLGVPHVLDPALDCGAGVDAAAARLGAAGSLISFAPVRLAPRVMLEHFANAPFHAMALFDPALKVVDYGDAENPASPGGRNKFTAAVWVHGLRDDARRPLARVVSWPEPLWPVPGTMRLADEWPSPLWQCDLSTSGPVIWFAAPAAGVAPVLTSLSLAPVGGGAAVQLCVYGADGLTKGDVAGRAVARQYLQHMSAVVVVPTTPLADGSWKLTGMLDGHPFSRIVTVGA
jgi:hypothetical protein